jgi:hypothetical protein
MIQIGVGILKICDFAELDPLRAEIARYDAIVEQSVPTSRIDMDTYPAADFRYSNYNVDPRPKVLLLGQYESEAGNQLLAGINLHYLSHGQTKNLRKRLKDLYLRKTLKARYWYLRRKMPDIAQYYRTYDEDEIHAIQPDQITAYGSKKAKKKEEVKPDPEDDQRKSQADLEKLANVATEPSEPPTEPDVTDVAADSSRDAWQLKRMLYSPDTGRRTKPETKPKDLEQVLDTKRTKSNRYRQQRRSLKKLEQQAEMDRIAAQLDKEKELDAVQDLYDKPEYDLSRIRDEPSEEDDEFRESISNNDFSYLPEYGFIWVSPESYIKWHAPPKFAKIIEHCEKWPLMAVHDTLSGRTLVDAVPDHSTILEEAGWDYDHTVLFELDGMELVSKFDSEMMGAEPVVDGFIKTEAGRLLAESAQRRSQIYK